LYGPSQPPSIKQILPLLNFTSQTPLTNFQNPNLNSPHQIIGLISVSLVLIQLTIGFIHHRIYIRTQQATPLSKIHRYAGSFVIFLGIGNGFVGFNFARNNHYEITYGLLVLIVGLTVAGALLMKQRRQRSKAAMTSTAAQNFNSAYAPGDIPLRDHAAPIAYGRPDQANYFAGQNQSQGFYGPQPGGRF
jgi:hypothetical protein